jgi:hypothetical protein
MALFFIENAMTDLSTIRTVLKAQGHSDADIDKIIAVMNHPEAFKYATQTKDFDTAYKMTLPKEEIKTQASLDQWFSEFCKVSPNDAEELSKYLTKFSRFVQSSVDKQKSQS